MKKLIILAATVIAAVSTQAQGLVNFNNSAAAGSKISTNSVAGGATSGLTGGAAGSFYYALFFSTTATTVNGSASAVVPSSGSTGSYAWTDGSWTLGAYATNAATVGRISGNSTQVISGVNGGGTARFVVVGWSANLGSTIAAAQASLLAGNYVGTAFLGQSVVSPLLTLGDGGLITVPTIVAASGAVTGFTLGVVPAAVPEPGTMALAALGGASLLLVRRKK